MTDPDSILQLGIEAAREGNKEEARNLFRLLVSEDANNVNAWLWLAGVSEDQAERQAALEKVLELDPHNETAAKGLQAFGKDFAATSTKPPAPSGQPTTQTTPSSAYDEVDFDDPFAELDALSDVFAGDSQAVGRPDTSASSLPESQKDSAHTSSTSSARTSASKSTASKSTASSYQRSSGSSREKGSKKPMTKLPVPSGINLRVVALVLAVIIVFMGLIFVVKPLLFDKPEVVVVPVTPKAAQQQAEPTMPPADIDQQPTMPPADQPVDDTGTGATTGVTPVDTQPDQPEVAVVVPTEPVAAPPPAPASGLTIIPPNNPLASNGWLYDFNQFVCGGNSCAAPWRANIGSYQAKGRFVIVLMMVVNNTGQDQPVPADFIVVKDAQNRTYNTLPQVSSAYVTPGVNADRSHEQPIPANGIATSVALVFDVPLDATDLVLYAPSQPSQGWLILQNVQ